MKGTESPSPGEQLEGSSSFYHPAAQRDQTFWEPRKAGWQEEEPDALRADQK